MRFFINLLAIVLSTIALNAGGVWNINSLNLNGVWLNSGTKKMYSYGDSVMVYYGYISDFFISYTQDGGKTWQYALEKYLPNSQTGVNLTNYDYENMRMLFVPPSTLILYTFYKPYTFTSDDWGKTWRSKEIKYKMRKDSVEHLFISDAVDTLHQVMVLKTKGGNQFAYTTQDGWKSYDSCRFGCSRLEQLSPMVQVAAAGGYIKHTQDGGKTWNYSKDRVALDKEYVRQIALEREHKIILAGVSCEGAETYSSKIYKSTDGGVTWYRTLFENDETRAGMASLSLSPSGAGIALCSDTKTPGANYLRPVIYVTKDFGETWERTNCNDTLKSFGFPMQATAGSLHNMWSYIMPYLYKYDTKDTIPVKVNESVVNSEVLLFPNPAKRGKEIKLYLGDLRGSKVSIVLYDVLGAKVDEFTCEAAPETISYRPDSGARSGSYTFVIECINRHIIKKIIIE